MSTSTLEAEEIIVTNGEENGVDQPEAESLLQDPLESAKRFPGFYPRKAFETPIPVRGLFDGDIFASVHEHGGVEPTTIIRTDQRWGVICKWKTSGSLVRMICGKWCLQLSLESMGPGPELRLPNSPVYVDLQPCKSRGRVPTVYYKYHLDIPAGVVTSAHCSTAYKLITTLTYKDVCGTPGPIAAYVEGPILQFYNP